MGIQGSNHGRYDMESRRWEGYPNMGCTVDCWEDSRFVETPQLQDCQYTTVADLIDEILRSGKN